ncbi:MAG: SDR family oxidoreductase [Chloroflexi bacterium]|nr:SDR family oxidoreductase [Chloroflexota bacterium]MDA1270717.1 SDR family oxidoreductase [Chloroflexota bacterium]
MRLEGKTALITGASRNIGKEIALTFAREGADLVLNTRNSEAELEEVASECRELGVKTHTVIANVAESASVTKMVADGIQALGKIDILVNNVAVRPHKPILEITDEEWHTTLGINLHAAFYLCRAVLPGMMERQSGSIIALGGQSAITGRPGTSIVTTAKTGVLGLIRAVAAEMAPYNIRANMVNPGSTDTSRGNPEWYPEFQAGTDRGSSEHLKSIPMGRQATVQDIANACLFFASDESGYITGDSVNVMGGRYIF